MVLHKSTVRVNVNPERGSATAYFKKEFTEKFIKKTESDKTESDKGLTPNKDYKVVWDDEKETLCIEEL